MPPVVTKQKPGAAKPTTPIKPLAESESAWDLVSDTLRMLVYGASGSGKTTFASTFPGPILWLICSGGNKPGELKSIDTPENRKKITPRIIKSTDQLKGFLADSDKYATKVLDHASGLADLILKEILRVDELPAQLGWGTASQQQYGQLALQCKEHFRALLNLSGNIVIIAQERVFGGKDDGVDSDIIKPTIGAALTPSVTGWLNPACDYVVQTFKKPRMKTTTNKIGGKDVTTTTRGKGVDYCIRTEAHDVFMTKFRIPRGRVLPDLIVDPTYEKVQAVIRGDS